MLESKHIRLAISGGDDDRANALDIVRMQYEWALDDLPKNKRWRQSTALAFIRIAMFRNQLAALGEVHPLPFGRA